MEFKVREISGGEQKSVQEIESELLKTHEEKNNDTDTTEHITEESGEQVETNIETEVPTEGLKEEDVLSFIKNRYNKEVSSVEDLFQQREEAEELPEDVAAYLKYKKETGRGFEDFSKLNRDIDNIEPDKLLKDYLTATEEALDEEDIEALMEDYSYDEDFDDESSVKKIKLKKKKAIAKAK